MLNNWYGPIQTLVYLCALSSKYSFTFFLQAQGSLTHLCQLQFDMLMTNKETASYALKNGLPLNFTVLELEGTKEGLSHPQFEVISFLSTMADQFSLRKL